MNENRHTHTHLETSRRERMIWVETMLSYVVMLWHQGGQPIPVGDAGALLAPGCPSGGGEIRPFYRGLGVPTGSRISTSWKISPYCYMIFLLFLIQEQDYSIIPSNVATCARPGSHGSTHGTKHGGFNQICYVYAHIHTYTRAHTCWSFASKTLDSATCFRVEGGTCSTGSSRSWPGINFSG